MSYTASKKERHMTNRNLNRMKSKGTNKKVEVNAGMMEKESNEKLNTIPQMGGRIACHFIECIEKVNAISERKDSNTRLSVRQREKSPMFQNPFPLLFLRMFPFVTQLCLQVLFLTYPVRPSSIIGNWPT